MGKKGGRKYMAAKQDFNTILKRQKDPSLKDKQA